MRPRRLPPLGGPDDVPGISAALVPRRISAALVRGASPRGISAAAILQVRPRNVNESRSTQLRRGEACRTVDAVHPSSDGSDPFSTLFATAAQEAGRFRATAGSRPVAPPVDHDALRRAFGGELQGPPRPAADVVSELISAAGPGLVATPGPRFFGFVVGGALPAASAADVLATGWDQNALNAVLSPAAMAAEACAGDWLKDLLGIPATASVGFVTGGQAANTVGLVAGRHRQLAAAGWDVERDGLAGAPPLRVVAGEERHATIDRSLRLLGLGTSSLETVATDALGALDVEDLARVLARRPAGPTIVCLQAGNVNTGACDPLRAATEVAHDHGGWVHVDGAFGLWAATSRSTRHLVDGVELADSWATDAHKWLNVPYDSGLAFCAHPDVHTAAVSYTASYLVGSAGPSGRAGTGVGADFTPESSRRARGFAVWAALRELGRDGVTDLVDRCCALARRFASGLAAGGAELGGEVVLNQVLVRFGDDRRTDAVTAAVQAEGTCWAGGTTWRGRRWMRISVSNHTTTDSDVDLSTAAILHAMTLS
jgi:glutamate/tyrosine decarboxylase-like PLP-dependent enzyme